MEGRKEGISKVEKREKGGEKEGECLFYAVVRSERGRVSVVIDEGVFLFSTHTLSAVGTQQLLLLHSKYLSKDEHSHLPFQPDDESSKVLHQVLLARGL